MDMCNKPSLNPQHSKVSDNTPNVIQHLFHFSQWGWCCKTSGAHALPSELPSMWDSTSFPTAPASVTAWIKKEATSLAATFYIDWECLSYGFSPQSLALMNHIIQHSFGSHLLPLCTLGCSNCLLSLLFNLVLPHKWKRIKRNASFPMWISLPFSSSHWNSVVLSRLD